jgi:hypothetical protein
MPGLTKRGDVWHIEKQIKGYGRLRESCGTTDLKEAERFLTHRLEEIRLAEVYGVRPTRTFEQAAIKYLEDYQYKRSIERDVIALRMVMPYIGQLPLDRVHNDALAKFRLDRRRAGRMAGTINKELAAVRRILNLAARVWRHPNGQTWLPAPPLLEMERGPARRPYPISWEEQGASATATISMNCFLCLTVTRRQTLPSSTVRLTNKTKKRKKNKKETHIITLYSKQTGPPAC